MDEQKHTLSAAENEAKQANSAVDESRRALGKAGLAAPVVLATLVSRPVLADVCPTPSAAGSGNASQHPRTGITCTGLGTKTPDTWRRGNNSRWPNQIGGNDFRPSDDFHPLFTADIDNLNLMIRKSTGNNATRSMTLGEVLNLPDIPDGYDTNNTGFNSGAMVSGHSMAAWFVAALLGSATGLYGNPAVLKTIGPDPSVRGIQDEYARNGVFEYTATKKWDATKIVQYFVDPWSLL